MWWLSGLTGLIVGDRLMVGVHIELRRGMNVSNFSIQFMLISSHDHDKDIYNTLFNLLSYSIDSDT